MEAVKLIGGGVRKIPFVTVVTDLGTAHPTWFDKEVRALCVHLGKKIDFDYMHACVCA
jgi:hypothetical protein